MCYVLYKTFSTFKDPRHKEKNWIRIRILDLPDDANGLKEGDVHEADGGRVVVNQVEPVDPSLYTAM